MIDGRILATILRTAAKLDFEPGALGRLFAQAPHLPPLFRRPRFLAGQSIALEALPPASRVALTERAAVGAWLDSLLALDRLARLDTATIRALAGPPLPL
jgi:hypothetical protein